MPIARPLAVVLDCADPVRMASFWAHVAGGETEPATAGNDWVSLRNVPGVGYLSFQRVPESKTSKNRVHLDLEVDDIVASTEEALNVGATLLGGVVDETTNLLQVMADIEGNEFCFVQRTPK